MNKNITKIIIAIIIVINIVLIAATTISIGSAVKRQLSSGTSVTTDVSFSTLVKEIFNSNNFIAIIKTIEGVNLIVFGVLIAIESRKY